MESHDFRRQLHRLHDRLKRFRQEKQTAKETDPSAALPDRGWKEIKIIDGHAWYTGPHYDLREFCDDYRLPWPESARILVAAILGSSESLEEPPLPDAWRAWRMARTGLGMPRPDEIARAKEALPELTPHGRERRFSRGLTQEAVARVLHVDERTVRQYIADCKRYIKGKSAVYVIQSAGLPLHYWPALDEHFSQQGEKPEE
jgi:DNA-binding CsgD family transcriptional regulator